MAKNKAYIKRKIVPSRQPIFSFDKKYHKKPDLIHVQKLLGNRNVLATQIYVNLEQALLREANDEYHVKVAETVEEAIKLIAVGYEYGSTMGDKQIYRKPKSNGKRGVSIES